VIKRKIFEMVDGGHHDSRLNKVFDVAIMSLVLMNVIVIIIESIPEIGIEYQYLFEIFEYFTIFVFSVEYLLRIYVSNISNPSNSKLKSSLLFIFSFYGLIDLLAVTPFYLPFLIKTDMRFIRILRAVRFFRILKINRYNNALNLILSVIKSKRMDLAITGFVSFVFLLVASFFMYFIEGEVQPEKFSSIIASFWWAIATLTTVGYGDVYPVTVFGKIVSGLLAVSGIVLVALPTGIISAGFLEKINNKNKEKKACPHCGKEIE
jgi:voltage-gated potassium channel